MPVLTDTSNDTSIILAQLGEMTDLISILEETVGNKCARDFTSVVQHRATMLLDRSVANLLGPIVALPCVQRMLVGGTDGKPLELCLKDVDADTLRGLCAKCTGLQFPEFLRHASVEVSTFLESQDEAGQLTGIKRPYWFLIVLPKVLDYAIQTAAAVAKLNGISEPISADHQADSVPADFKTLPDILIGLLQLGSNIVEEFDKITPIDSEEKLGVDLLSALRVFKDRVLSESWVTIDNCFLTDITYCHI